MKLTLSPLLAALFGSTLSAFELVSVDPSGAPIAGESADASVSDDGRFVAFLCRVDIVPEDTNGRPDVYVRDRLLKTTTLVSATPSGDAGEDSSRTPKISGDGSAVVFLSSATDLVPGIDSGRSNVFVRNLSAGTTSAVSVNAAGDESNGFEFECSISQDGSKVVFSSSADNLISPVEDNNDVQDIFLAIVGDPTAIQRVSVGSAGEEANGSSRNPVISADGKFVAFESNATLNSGTTVQYAKIYRKDLTTGEVIFASASFDNSEIIESADYPSISGDGSKIVFNSYADNLVSGDTNNEPDIFLYDVDSETLSIISRASNGDLANDYNNVPGGNAISNDGRFVIFESTASNLTTDPVTRTNLYRLDLQTGLSQLISKSATGVESDGPITFAEISGNGQEIVIASQAFNLLPNATGGVQDILAWPGAAAQPSLSVFVDNSFARAKLSKKIKKLKKKMKAAKRKKQVRKAKKLKKKVKKLTRRLRSL